MTHRSDFFTLTAAAAEPNPICLLSLLSLMCTPAAILKHLGVINSKTRLAGASGGSANAALTCANVPLQQQYSDLFRMATTCRPAGGCAGFLDTQGQAVLMHGMTPKSAQDCSGRLFVSVTAAYPDGKPDVNVLIGPDWRNTQQLQAAVRASTFIPLQSGRSATVQLPELAAWGERMYDGGFSGDMPCPLGEEIGVLGSAGGLY